MYTEQNHVQDYTIIKKLGCGASSTVHLAENSYTGAKRALKFMNCCTEQQIENERKFFEKVPSHRHILQYHGYKENVEYTSQPGHPSKRISYLDLEHAEHGEIYHFISRLGAFPEPIARYYFK